MNENRSRVLRKKNKNYIITKLLVVTEITRQTLNLCPAYDVNVVDTRFVKSKLHLYFTVLQPKCNRITWKPYGKRCTPLLWHSCIVCRLFGFFLRETTHLKYESASLWSDRGSFAIDHMITLGRFLSLLMSSAKLVVCFFKSLSE